MRRLQFTPGNHNITAYHNGFLAHRLRKQDLRYADVASLEDMSLSSSFVGRRS